MNFSVNNNLNLLNILNFRGVVTNFSSGCSENFMRFLEIWVQSSFKRGKYYNLFDIFSDPKVLEVSYLRLRSRCNSTVFDLFKKNLSVYEFSWFKKMSVELRAGKYKTTFWCKLQSLKLRTHPFISRNFQDLIIQEALTLVLSIIYEPRFSEFSFGLQRDRGIHEALHFVRGWVGEKWVLNLKISQSFDCRQWGKLISILVEDIGDSRLLTYLHQLFRLKLLDNPLSKFYKLAGSFLQTSFSLCGQRW